MAVASPAVMECESNRETYSRKQKSLGLLCSNFVALYDREGAESIVGLDNAARRLGVERRRIYDIVNVLEVIGVLARRGKNQYTWIGFSGIPSALENLKEDKLKEATSFLSSDKVSDDEDEDDCLDEKMSQNTNGSSNRGRSEHKREKSLGQLTQNFIKLFLARDAHTISLDDAAKLLLGDSLDSCQMRTKVRRLYDIGNVLCSMNLIEKTQQLESKKPAFHWLGVNGKPSPYIVTMPSRSSRYSKQWKKRAFGTDITNTDNKRVKLDPELGDQKPCIEQDGRNRLKECNLAVQMQLGGPRGYVFGPFRPLEVPTSNENVAEKSAMGKVTQDWENLASSFRPQYHNQALNDLFVHYMDAWKSWYSEVTQGSKILYPYKCASRQLL